MVLLLFGGFTLLMLVRVPVTVSIAGSVTVAMIAAGFGDSLYVLPQQVLDGIDSPPLLAVPFFILAGNLMNAVGMTDRIFGFAAAMVGHLRAGLAQVNVLASMVFAGVSGAAVADLAGLGTVEIKAMRERGYPEGFSAAVTLASSVVGPIIPPSVPLLIYAFISNTSVGRLFLAGAIPGLLLGISLLVFNRILAARILLPQSPRASMRVRLRSALDGFAALVAPAVILISITTGAVTATEAGVLASAYALVVGALYRSLRLAALWRALTDTALITALIMMIIGFATAMGWLLAIEQAPQALGQWLLTLTDSRWVFIALLLAFLLLIGMLLDGIPAILILAPMLLPLADHFGLDRVHFGIVFVMAIVFGLATPPMGMGLYILVGVARLPFEVIVRAVLPFLIPLAIVLVLVAYLPILTLWLPNAVFGPP